MSFFDSLYGDASRVTVELRDIVTGDHPVNIWDFEYPSYYKDEAKRAFEQKVIDHFYFRQIGAETVGRWLHMFRTRVREIMPYYLQMYKSVEIMEDIEDPFATTDIVETYEQETTGGRTGSTTEGQSLTNQSSRTTSGEDSRNESGDKEHRFSNTPQSSIENLDDYLTEASRDTETITASGNRSESSEATDTTTTETEGSSTEQTTGTNKYTLTRKGSQGVTTYAHDMIELRQSFINVDMMIINDLQDLFLMVY